MKPKIMAAILGTSIDVMAAAGGAMAKDSPYLGAWVIICSGVVASTSIMAAYHKGRSQAYGEAADLTGKAE